MRTLFEKDTLEEIIGRINKLTPETQRVWGTMRVDQMLAHCTVGMQTATGEKFLQSNILLRMIGSLLRSQITNDKPFRRSSPTHPGFIIGNTGSFEKEKQILLSLIQKFHDGSGAKCTTNPHAFFGKLTTTQWSSLMFKHLDHHLRQFGV
ncbi:MAG: DUF1569 domain-containing protein [Ignavibacteriales bacterium]|nr:DUF1569 domain-containing protein [Ignavibacteriales bacterium]